MLKRRGMLVQGAIAAEAVVAFSPSRKLWLTTREPYSVDVPKLEGELVISERMPGTGGFLPVVASDCEAVLVAGSVDDIARMVRFASDNDVRLRCGVRDHLAHRQPWWRWISSFWLTSRECCLVIDTSELREIGPVQDGSVWVGVGVSWDDLFRETWMRGYAPGVWNLGRGVTVGDALASGWGLPRDAPGCSVREELLELEVITHDGEVVRCSPTERSPLFEAVCRGGERSRIVVRARIRLFEWPAVWVSPGVVHKDLSPVRSREMGARPAGGPTIERRHRGLSELSRGLAALSLCSLGCGLLEDAARKADEARKDYSDSTTVTFIESTGGESSGSSESSGVTETGDGSGSGDLETSTGAIGTTSGGSSGGSTEGGTSLSSGSASGSSGGIDSYCGDGILDVDLGEECDGGLRCYDCLLDRLVFVTSTQQKGNFGGIESADDICNMLAVNPDNPWITPEEFMSEKRIMRAWLSGPLGVVDRFSLGKGRYVRTDGEVVVWQGSALIGGTLENPIVKDEKGQVQENYVWTNTKENGVPFSGVDHCDGWTNSSAFLSSTVGWSGSTNSEWSHSKSGVNPQLCAFAYHIYCVEAQGGVP